MRHSVLLFFIKIMFVCFVYPSKLFKLRTNTVNSARVNLEISQSTLVKCILACENTPCFKWAFEESKISPLGTCRILSRRITKNVKEFIDVTMGREVNNGLAYIKLFSMTR